MSNKKLVEFLETRYQKSFEVQASNRIPDIGITRYSVVCTDFPEIPFTVDYRPQTDSFIANFEQNLWTFQSKKYIGSILKKHFEKYALQSSVRAKADYNPADIPSFEELLENETEELSLNIRIHLFKDLTSDSYTQILQPIVELSNTLINKGIKQTSFTLSFYDETFFKDMKLSEFEFGFNTVDEMHFEVQQKDKCTHKILFRIYSTSPTIDADQLYNFRSNNPDELMFKHIR